MAIDNFRRVDFTLDKANDYIIDDQLAKVGDIQGRDLVVQITNAGVIQNQPDIKLTFSWHNKKVGNSGMIDFRPLDSSQGIFIVTFPDAMNNTGNVVATIGINENGKWTFSRNFIIRVEENAFTASVPLESDDWETLLVALDKVNHLSELTEAQLKEYLEKSKEEWAAFVEANKDVITAIDPGGVLLDEIIKSRKPLDSPAYATLGERLDHEFNELPFTEIIKNTIIRDEFKPPLQELKASIPQDKFNMAFFTDAHYEKITKAYPYGYLSLDHLNNVLDVQDKVDVLVAGGDNTNSYSLNIDAIKHEINQFSDRFMLTGTKADRFMLLGNHDDGSLRSVAARLNRPIMRSEIADGDFFKKAYRTGNKMFGEIRNGNSLYFYKDYPNKKIRLIGVNTMDIDDTLTKEDGSIRYNRQHDFAVRQDQLKWLAEVALANVPEDYHTMVVTHAHATIESVGSGANLETHHNFDLMMNLLEAFKQGNNVTLVSTEPDFEVNITASFSANGPRTLIGYFNGHVHDERIGVYTQFGSTYTCCCLLNAVTNRVEDRPLGTPEEDAWTIISVDTDARKVNLIGFGKATNREFEY